MVQLLDVFDTLAEIPAKIGGDFLLCTLRVADSFWKRFAGLMFRKEMCRGEGLWLVPCRGVHTFFMRFPIDVVYLSQELRVLKVVEGLKPWRLGPVVKGAESVLELPAGEASALGLGEGDSLEALRSWLLCKQ